MLFIIVLLFWMHRYKCISKYGCPFDELIRLLRTITVIELERATFLILS